MLLETKEDNVKFSLTLRDDEAGSLRSRRVSLKLADENCVAIISVDTMENRS